MNVRPYLDQRVALFGSLGNWRESIAIPMLKAANVLFFNPIVPNWTAECMADEARHMAHDAVIMIVITGGSTGFASMIDLLAAANFAQESGQRIVAMIEDMPPDRTPRKDECGGALNPNGNRELLRQYLQRLNTIRPETIHLCPTVAEATGKVIELLSTAPVS